VDEHGAVDTLIAELEDDSVQPVRPWWSRAWIWVVALLRVLTVAGLFLADAAAGAAGGCGGG
jgi:hypothetical protein